MCQGSTTLPEYIRVGLHYLNVSGFNYITWIYQGWTTLPECVRVGLHYLDVLGLDYITWIWGLHYMNVSGLDYITWMCQGWTTLPECIRAGLHYLNVSVEDSMFWSLGESRPELPIVWVHNLSIGESAYVISAKGTVSRKFWLRVILMKHVFLTPEYSIRDIYIFFLELSKIFETQGAPLI